MIASAELNAIRNEHTRAVLAELLRGSGIRPTGPAAGYLIARMRWHLGLRKGYVTPPSGALQPDELAFIETRALELLEQAHHLLPPIQREDTTRHPVGTARLAHAAGAGIPDPADLPPNVVPITAARSRP